MALVVLLAACSSPRIQPLMPTPLLFTELDIGPLDHIPPEQRWTPRRVYRNSAALTVLIERLAVRSVARSIHIVAWSAGGRPVTRAPPAKPVAS